MGFWTEKMVKLVCATLKENAHNLSFSLLKLGTLDFIDISDERLEEYSAYKTKKSSFDFKGIMDSIETVFNQAHLSVKTISGKTNGILNDDEIFHIQSEISKTLNKIKGIRDSQGEYYKRRTCVEELLETVKNNKNGFLSIFSGTFVGEIKTLHLKLHGYPFVVLQNESGEKDELNVLCLKRDRYNIDKILSDFSFRETNMSKEHQDKFLIVSEEHLNKTLSRFTSEIEACESKVNAIVKNNESEFADWYSGLRVTQLSHDIYNKFLFSEYTLVFSAWIPEHEVEKAKSVIMETTENNAVIKIVDEKIKDRSKIPAMATSMPILKPFENIVANYGIPAYGTINPIPFATVVYLLMFSLMFADFGQGLVILLLGLFLSLVYKKNPNKKDGIIPRSVANLMIYLGPFSMIGGLLFGSVFGFADVLPALWFNFHYVVNGHPSGSYRDVFSILGLSVYFGIAVIELGLVLNWFNLIRLKEWGLLIFGKNGLCGATLYLCGIIMAFGFVKTGYKTFPNIGWIKPVVIVALIILFLKVPFCAIEKREFKGIIMNTIMEFLLGVLEIFSGYLSNTLSFLRVAGLGIAHASLIGAFFTISKMTTNPLLKVLVIVLGNIIVIALEGLSAGIQALRLNYYEFFTKFFVFKGKKYNPISLNK